MREVESNRGRCRGLVSSVSRAQSSHVGYRAVAAVVVVAVPILACPTPSPARTLRRPCVAPYRLTLEASVLRVLNGSGTRSGKWTSPRSEGLGSTRTYLWNGVDEHDDTMRKTLDRYGQSNLWLTSPNYFKCLLGDAWNKHIPRLLVGFGYRV